MDLEQVSGLEYLPLSPPLSPLHPSPSPLILPPSLFFFFLAGLTKKLPLSVFPTSLITGPDRLLFPLFLFL